MRPVLSLQQTSPFISQHPTDRCLPGLIRHACCLVQASYSHLLYKSRPICRMAAPPQEVSRGFDAPSGTSLLSLHYSKVEKPDEEDETHVVLATQAVHAQICPAVVQAAAAVVAHCMQAIKPGTASGSGE